MVSLGALEKEHHLWDGKLLGFGAITQLLCSGLVVLVERGWVCCDAAWAHSAEEHLSAQYPVSPWN